MSAEDHEAGEPTGDLAIADTASPRLPARPAGDKLVRAVARAKIAEQLFATRSQVKLGRYHLLELVGTGGMGVVWGAWDPELDRRVAIKLVKAELVAARERILLEGQALAKLSHPNVVPVYDVGVVDEQIYLVMEWVRGKNLRAFCAQPRTAREIVAIYRAAGEGLSAAHRAGLIHRDFKPDNAMIGDDGRVRVLDFGLASSGSEITPAAGTPRYMPPEQAEGRPITPAADQYAFGASLREALAGRDGGGKDAALPRWLADIVERSTAPEPAHRYASMDALLHALARDPATIWRRRLVIASAIAVAGAAFAVGTVRGGGDAPARCTGGAAEIATTWNAGTRGWLVAHLRTLGPYGARSADEQAGALAGYAGQWSSAHRGACLAKDGGDLTPQLYERNLGCLARARVALGTITGVLATVGVDRLPDAIVAAQALPDPARCLVESQTSSSSPPPAAIADQVAALSNEIERARVLALATDPQAIRIAEHAVAQAGELGHAPLIGRASLVHGVALLRQQRGPAAIAALQRAASAALAAGDHATAVEAIARELYAIATAASASELPAATTDTLAAITITEPLARGLGPGGAFARALLFNNLGTLRLSQRDRDAARGWFEEALAARHGIEGDSVELASIAGNLGLVLDDPARRDELIAREGRELAAALGADHPLTLDARLKAAMFVADPGVASTLLGDACARYRRLHPHLTVKISQCASEVLWLAEERGDREAARDAREALAALASTETLEASLGIGYQLLVDGKPAEAAHHMREIADGLARQEHYWLRWRSVDALIIAALAEHARGRGAQEILDLRRALATMGELAFIEATTFYQRRLARVRLLLARTGVPDARELARAAATWYRAAGGYDALAAELEAIASSSR